MNIFKSIIGFFSSDSGSSTAMKIVEKIAGVDGMTAKEKADFMLSYQEVTKHQSPARRIIAFSFTGLYIIAALLYLGAVQFDNVAHAATYKEFLKDVISQPMNLVIGFYFTMSIANGIKGR